MNSFLEFLLNCLFIAFSFFGYHLKKPKKSNKGTKETEYMRGRCTAIKQGNTRAGNQLEIPDRKQREKINAESVAAGESAKPKTRTRSESDVAKREGATGGREGEQKHSP